jgi:acetoin utilization deacetylase AcuC-like enzyme
MAVYKTGFFYDELCMWHDPGSRGMFDGMGLYFQPTLAYENAETKRRLKNLLEVSGVMEGLVRYSATPATHEELLRFHDKAYIDRLANDSQKGSGNAGAANNLGDGAPFS